jgi:hypothetical protein
MQQRTARYGAHLYEVRVPQTDIKAPLTHADHHGRVYLQADSVTVTPAGALILACEVPPLEAEDDEATTAIEYPPCAVFAPGQWLSLLLVSQRAHEVLFSEESMLRILDEDDD